MDKKKLVVKIIGWIFIVGAFAILIAGIIPKETPPWLNELRLLSPPTREINVQQFHDITSRVIETSLTFFLAFFA